MIDVTRYHTQDRGDDTTIIIEANTQTICINDNEAIVLIKELFKTLGNTEQYKVAEMFRAWLQQREGV